MVDVGVGDDDLLDGEMVPGERRRGCGDVVAGVDDDGFARGFVAEDGAVALEQADGKVSRIMIWFMVPGDYFFAVSWLVRSRVVLMPERTEWLADWVRDMTMVRPIART